MPNRSGRIYLTAPAYQALPQVIKGVEISSSTGIECSDIDFISSGGGEYIVAAYLPAVRGIRETVKLKIPMTSVAVVAPDE